MTLNSCDSVKPRQMRKIKPTRRSVSGIYPFRGEVAIPYESTLERDFVVRVEFFQSVLDIIPQPVEIDFKGANGQPYQYTPDYLVYYHLGDSPYGNYPRPLLVEVKPKDEWRRHWREWLPKWKAAWRYAKEQGWAFHIHDESRIRDQSLKNIQFLERYKRMQFPAEESNWIVESIRLMGASPFHFILARHFMGAYQAEGVAHIWHLLATRRLDCDISRPLNNFTELWVPANA
jgi:hypothetical protein